MALSKHFKRSNLAQKILNYMHGLKSAILAIFQKGLLVPPSKMHHSIWKNIFVLGADECLELEGKIRKCFLCYIKIFWIKVWAGINSHRDSILGTREFPFTYQLPVDLPESLEDSRYATITYTVKRFPFI